QNNGQYRPGSATGVYVESTYENCTSAPVLGRFYTLFSGIDDFGKVTESWYSATSNKLITKIEQGSKTKAQVKADLQKGQYCMYDNHDGSYTFMMKWHDMNDPNGATYNDLPDVVAAGGVGSYLKKTYPGAFGDLSDSTIQKINNLHNGKALQNLMWEVVAPYKTVKEPTAVENEMKITTDQTGEKSYTTKALMLPVGATSEADNDPLAIRLVKSDRYTGEKLSDGFKFELQKSIDGGNSWNKVNLTAAMIKSGQLNADGTITPKNGVAEVKNLTGGQKYRFVEKAHAAGYQNTKIDEAHPNSATHFTSANSRAVDVKNTGKGHVVNMYNAKLPAPAKIVIGGKKNLSGRAVKNGEFRFQLFDKITDDKVGQPVKNDSHGNFKKEMSFDKEGVYKYYFTELNDRQKGITYDISKKPVTIEVKKGNDGNMQANVISAPIMFNNKFTPDPSVPNMPNKPTNPTPTTKVVKTVRGPRTGDNTNIGLFVLLLAGASGALAATQVFKRKKR
ncbi:Spy0128 family protein, partial [Mogibacterium timidum]|uniref:Spy0128 family protein n=1 Tax=Mogibacterium timidum TaxID=35519 RepID=UPI00248AAD72